MHDRRPTPSAPSPRPTLPFCFLGRPAWRYRAALARTRPPGSGR
jgi:hypothetical protein